MIGLSKQNDSRENTVFGSKLYKTSALCLGLAVLLSGCGGGDSGRGGFTNPEDVISVSIRTADSDNQLDANLGLGDCGLQTSTTVLVELFDQEGQFFPAPSVTVDVVPGSATGVLCTPVPAGQEDDDPLACGGLLGPFSRASFEMSSGIERMVFLSGGSPGTVSLVASAADPNSNQLVSKRLDLNVVETIPIGPPVTSMAFTGPFVNAVLAGENTLGLQAGENILQDGSYQRLVSIVATDENGNPPVCTGRLFDFFAIDGPLVGYPASGPGSFAIAGPNGNPEEGGVTFRVPAGTGGFNGAVLNGPRVRPLNDRLVLDGRQEKNPGGAPQPNNRIFSGIWRVESVLTNDALTVEQDLGAAERATPPFPFNPANADTGFTVPYLIGSALRANVLSGGSAANEFGVANTVLTYPVYRLGQTAALVACTRFLQDLSDDGRLTLGSGDRKVCTVLNTCDANGADCNSVFLPVTNGTDIVLTASPTVLDANASTPLTLCLRDPNFAPLPATEITYNFESGLGTATVTIDGDDAPSGVLTTGAGGCVTVTVEASGQAPGTEPIPITFEADGVAEPVVVEIPSPGAGNLLATLDCGGQVCVDRTDDEGNPITNPAPLSCTVGLLLTDDRGGPIPDIPITHSSSAPLLSYAYNPPFGDFGITDENGGNTFSATANTVGDPPTITFAAGAASTAVALALPDCIEGEPPVLPEASISGGDAALLPGESTTLTVNLSAPATEALTIGLSTSGDTSRFTVSPTSVSFSAGQSSASVTVTAADTAAEGDSITISLNSGDGYVLGSPSSATVTVGAVELPTVSLVDGAATVAPGGTANLAVSLSEPAESDLTINVLVTGDIGSFVAPLPTSVTIPAGASSAPLPVMATSDAADGDAITLTLTSGSGYALGDPASATVTVSATLPEASLSGGDTTVSSGASANFAVVLDQLAQSDVTINILETGDADQFTVPSSVTISAGSSSATFSVTASGSAADGDAVTITLVSGSGYAVGDPSSVTVTVEAAPEEPTVTIIAPADSVAESGGTVTFTVQLDAASSAALSIPFTVGGSATFGSDYTLVTISPVQVAAGSTTASLQVQIINDTVDDDGENLTITLQSGTGYSLGTPATATIAIIDDD